MEEKGFNRYQLLSGPFLFKASLAFLHSQLKRVLNVAFV